jgi:hypothetical protein
MGSALLCAIAFVVFLPFLLLLLRENKGPIQFNLRTLLVAMTLVALILGGVGWWRMVNLAQVRWLDPASPEAVELVASIRIVRIAENGEGKPLMVYETRNGSMHVKVVCGDRDEMEKHLRSLRGIDELEPGEMVMRGRVVDAEGAPVGGARIDLMGPYVYINHFETREDGTFTMPITPNEGWGYYLRIRPQSREPEATGRFSLSYDEPERVVIVRLP